MVATAPPAAPGEDLEALLARRVEAARSRLLQTGGLIDSAELDEIERIARLIALGKDTKPPKPPHRTLAVALLVGTLVVISVLMYARMAETEVEVEATTSQFGFRLQGPQTLSEGMEVEELLVSCACDMRVPGAPGQPVTVVPSEGGNVTVRLATTGSGERRGSITLAPIALSSDSVVRLGHRGTPGRYDLGIEAPELELRVNVYGPILVAIPDAPPATVDFLIPKAMLVSASGKVLALEVQASGKGGLGLAPQILVNELTFIRIDEPLGPGQPVRRVSTIAGGTLYWEALNGRERTIRHSEQIDFDRVRGEILAVNLTDSDIALRFHGAVGGVTAGHGDNRRSLMPTWLEWLRARHSLSLLWGSTIYIAGLLLGALRWFKIAV